MSEPREKSRLTASWRRGFSCGPLACVVVLAVAGLPLGAGPGLGGPAKVVDGNQLRVDGSAHRLYGIKAPPPGTPCQIRGRFHDCGALARAGLMDLTAGADVKCAAAPAGQEGSRCRADGYDLSEGMVYTGWALARGDAPERLKKLMGDAIRKQHGMWQRKGRLSPGDEGIGAFQQ